MKQYETKLKLEDKYKNKDHNRKLELMTMRNVLAIELIELRDKKQDKRHQQKLEIIGITNDIQKSEKMGTTEQRKRKKKNTKKKK